MKIIRKLFVFLPKIVYLCTGKMEPVPLGSHYFYLLKSLKFCLTCWLLMGYAYTWGEDFVSLSLLFV